MDSHLLFDLLFYHLSSYLSFIFDIICFFEWSANGKRSNTFSEQFFELAEKAVCSEGSAGMGAQANCADFFFVNSAFQFVLPFFFRNHFAPIRQVK